IGNSQCSVSGVGSSAQISGSVLTLTLNISFGSTYAGNKVIYAASRSATQNTGWQAMGTWTAPGAPATSPSVGGVTPARGTGLTQVFTFTFTDNAGYQDLGVVNVIINSALDGLHSCYLAYSRPANTLFLVNDGSTALLPGLLLNGTGTTGNSQCSI